MHFPSISSKAKIYLYIFSIVFISQISFGQSRYFSAEGKEITKYEYDEINNKRSIELEEFKANIRKQISTESNTNDIAFKNEKDKRFSDLDSKGRPMFDNQGRMITYADQEKKSNTGLPDLRNSPALQGFLGGPKIIYSKGKLSGAQSVDEWKFRQQMDRIKYGR
jgi:hypothetical protein